MMRFHKPVNHLNFDSRSNLIITGILREEKTPSKYEKSQ